MTHGCDDALIASAATKIARNGFANGFVAQVWVRVILQEGVDGHQKAWSAEAALQTVIIVKCLLQRVQSAIGTCQSFDGEYFPTIGLHGKHQARANRYTIEDD